MDDFKRQNVNMATKFDWNAPRYVRIRPANRRSIGQMLRRYARRKLKRELKFDSYAMITDKGSVDVKGG